MSRIRILLADDHALVLSAFERLLSADFDVVGQASDAGRQIKHNDRDVKLIFLTMNEDTDLAAEAFRCGASGYLLKRSAASELITAIRQVMMGRSYVTPLITDGVIGSLLHPDEQTAKELTPRQREVLQLVVEGRSMKEVAAILDLTPRTVAFHKYGMMRQLKLKTTAELVHYAIKHHVV